MKKGLMLCLAVMIALLIAKQAFAMVDLNVGKYIYNEKEIPGFKPARVPLL